MDSMKEIWMKSLECTGKAESVGVPDYTLGTKWYVIWTRMGWMLTYGDKWRDSVGRGRA